MSIGLCLPALIGWQLWTDILDIQFAVDENRDGSHNVGLFAFWPRDATCGLRKFYYI